MNKKAPPHKSLILAALSEADERFPGHVPTILMASRQDPPAYLHTFGRYKEKRHSGNVPGFAGGFRSTSTHFFLSPDKTSFCGEGGIILPRRSLAPHFGAFQSFKRRTSRGDALGIPRHPPTTNRLESPPPPPLSLLLHWRTATRISWFAILMGRIGGGRARERSMAF